MINYILNFIILITLFLFGINNLSTQETNRLQIGSASTNAGYTGISMYGSGGDINLVPNGTNIEQYVLRVAENEVRINSKIGPDNQYGIYARFG